MNGASSNENSVSNAQEVVRTDAELQQAARAIQEDLHEQRNIMLKRINDLQQQCLELGTI